MGNLCLPHPKTWERVSQLENRKVKVKPLKREESSDLILAAVALKRFVIDASWKNI